MRIRTLAPAVLAGSFTGATILAGFDRDWVWTGVLAVLAVIAGAWALRVKKRVENP